MKHNDNIDSMPTSLASGANGLIWVQSDLQLADPERARQCLTGAVDDLLALELPIDAIWCLGDATVGANLADLRQVADESRRLLARLNAPVCYVMGNHELDTRRKGIAGYPLYEAARQWSDWHSTDKLSDFYFTRDFFGCRVYFFGDHAAEDGSWWVSHGALQEHPEPYIHDRKAYQRLRREIAASTVPVLTAAHNAFPGGQRPGKLLASLLPLPATVRAHFYGHAHIGDLVFNAEFPWQREFPIAETNGTRQYNISALESRRSPGSHSALLEFKNHHPVRLHIRCHLEHRWLETFDMT